MSELDKLVAERDELRGRIASLSGTHIDEELEALRRKRIGLEHEWRRHNPANGTAEAALDVERQLVVIDAAVRRVEAAKAGLDGQKREAEREVAALNAGIRTERQRAQREAFAKATPELVKGVLKLHEVLDGIEESRLEDRAKYGVTTDVIEADARAALNDVLKALGEKPHQSPAARAAGERGAERANADKKATRSAALRNEEERLGRLVRSGRLQKDKAEKILVGERARLEAKS